MSTIQTVCGDALTHESVSVRRTLYVTGTVEPTIPDPFPLGPMDTLVGVVIPITGVFVFAPHTESARTTTSKSGPEVSAVPPSSSSSSTVIHWDTLQLALSRVLDYYPHLAGRLRVLPSGVRTITSLKAGAALVGANCSKSLAELRAARPILGAPNRLSLFHLPADGNALLAPYDIASPEALSTNPVLSVQFTRFACGGVSIGIRILHTVTDASGFFMFARHLAEAYRGIAAMETRAAGGEIDLGRVRLASPPAIHGYGTNKHRKEEEERVREGVDANARKNPPPLFHTRVKPTKASPATREAANAEANAPATAVPPVCGRELFFSARDLASLKARAVELASTTPERTRHACRSNSSQGTNKDGWVSTFEALTALLWQRTFIARELLSKREEEEEKEKEKEGIRGSGQATKAPSSTYLTSFDVRQQLQHRGDGAHAVLPMHYFPNALTTPILTVSPEVLRAEPLSPIATALHNLIRYSEATKGAYWLRVADWVTALSDKTCVESDFEGGVMTSQWNKIDMYDGVCFVAGEPPVLVGTTFTPISLVDGLGYFLPDRQPSQQQLQQQQQRSHDGVEAVPEGFRDGSAAEDGGLTVYYALSEPVWQILESDPTIAPHIVMGDGLKKNM